jgi:hypothetical protein
MSVKIESSDFKLVLVKTVHTLVWIFFNVVIFYLLYSAIADSINAWTWICLLLIVGEGIVLLLSGNICPITTVARKYSSSSKENFDIFLPLWLAKYNKQIYTVIVMVAVGILVYRLFEK